MFLFKQKKKQNPTPSPSYSKEDIVALMDCLDWIELETHTPLGTFKLTPTTAITVDGVTIALVKLYSTVYYRVTEKIKTSPVLTCSLEEVPLHINSSPELAQWRLRIAK